MSAQTLSNTLGTTYRVAWAMLHRYRVAMVRVEREPLQGDVEVDEVFVGGIDHGGRPGRGTRKCIVVIAVEIKQPRGFGRIRMRHVPDASGRSLVPFVCDVVASDSVVLTDGWQGYGGLSRHGYTRKISPLSASGDSSDVPMPGVHRVASLLKRWILGTHHGSIDPVHLQSYLEEFTFRFNRRKSRSRGKLFFRLVQQAVAAEPTTYRSIIESARADWSPNHNLLGVPE